MSSILSVNSGRPAPTTAPGPGVTGIGKEPVASIEVRAPGPKRARPGSGVVGDFIGSPEHHGGDSQAVYAVAREELDWWARELGRDLPNGMFGENLTTTGLDVDAGVIGERWRVGTEVVLEVSAPRIPCQTFATRMGEKHWVKRFSDRGRVGAYLAVVSPGTIRPGDAVEVVERPGHGVTVPDVLRAWYGDVEAGERVLAAECLNPDDHDDLARRMARRAESTRTR